MNEKGTGSTISQNCPCEYSDFADPSRYGMPCKSSLVGLAEFGRDLRQRLRNVIQELDEVVHVTSLDSIIYVKIIQKYAIHLQDNFLHFFEKKVKF